MTRADRLALVWAAVTGALAVAMGPSLLTLGLPAAVFAALLADGVVRPASSVLVSTHTRGRRTGRGVAITFDDGPDPEHTPAIADALADAGARATFFCIGERLEAHPDLARRLVEAGHEIGNHSHSHPRTLNFRGVGAMEEEIARGADAVQAITDERSEPLYRPPVGLKNPALARIARRRGLRVVTWSLHGRDTGQRDGRAIADRVLERVRIGDIVLLHDGSDAEGVDRSATVEAVPIILDGLAARGLRSVTVSELLAHQT
ncbi:MAG: polysaccharide deacetylase family protein [Myxococcota bacterium]